MMVKRILRESKYPPDHQEAAMELVLAQVQAIGNSWGV
jgi:type I restriction enzyme, R subunit